MIQPYGINPIDLMPFIGVPQDPEAQKRKLIKLYETEAKALFDKGDMEAYNLIQEKIQQLTNENK